MKSSKEVILAKVFELGQEFEKTNTKVIRRTNYEPYFK